MQADAVAKKLQELNPGFDGGITPGIEQGEVTSLTFPADNVTDISPVRALAGLKILGCSGSDLSKGILSDLSPLQGIPLTYLYCANTPVSDLSPLQGMPLTVLQCYTTPVSDLSPLADCKRLPALRVRDTKVTASGVAALQKALPKCKIAWDDPAQATPPAPIASGTK